jgi:hypothetical protein
MIKNASLFFSVLVVLANASFASQIYHSTGSSFASLSRRSTHIVNFDKPVNFGFRGTSTNLALRGGDHQHGLRYAHATDSLVPQDRNILKFFYAVLFVSDLMFGMNK